MYIIFVICLYLIFFIKENSTFIQQICNELIKSDSYRSYNVTKY